MKTHLKVKIKTLAVEAGIIKFEERRWGTKHPMFSSLHEHRRTVLRKEARVALLAYGFLRGRDYVAIESGCHFPPDWDRIEYHVRQFGSGFAQGRKIDLERDVLQRYLGWLDAAKAYSSKNICTARRISKDERRTARRQAYKARYWRPEPTDQAALKAALKAKWEGGVAI